MTLVTLHLKRGKSLVLGNYIQLEVRGPSGPARLRPSRPSGAQTTSNTPEASKTPGG